MLEAALIPRKLASHFWFDFYMPFHVVSWSESGSGTEPEPSIPVRVKLRQKVPVLVPQQWLHYIRQVFKPSILVRGIRIRIQTYCTMYTLHLMDPDRIRGDIQKVRAFKQKKKKNYVKLCQYRTVYSMPYCFISSSLRKNWKNWLMRCRRAGRISRKGF